MDEFAEKLSRLDGERIKTFLEGLLSPCYESDLFKIAFPENPVSDSEPLVLYQNHFLLFHVLYILKDEYYKKGKLLHVHFMRTFLADYPRQGACLFYDEYSGIFCGDSCAGGRNLCVFHSGLKGDDELDELSAGYFYMDKSNFYKLDNENAGAFIRGTWDRLIHYDDYRKSLKILDLPDSADPEMIKSKFKKLAKIYHPDIGNEERGKFIEINSAYRLLLRVMAMKKD